MGNCRLVYGLKYGNDVFEQGDIIKLKLKGESTKYHVRLYDFHQDHCEGFLCGTNDDEQEFYFDYADVEWIRKSINKGNADELMAKYIKQNKNLYEIMDKILSDNSCPKVNFKGTTSLIVCKDNDGKLIGLIYINTDGDLRCRLFKFTYDQGENPMAYDYDCLLSYIKDKSYSCVKYLYSIDEIENRINSFRRTWKDSTIIELTTNYSVLDDILNITPEQIGIY